MLSRPLDLVSRLRPMPRSFDHVFLINLGLIVLFFQLFESPYVLAPVLEVGGLELPAVAGAKAGARPATLRITVKPGGTAGPAIFVDTGYYNIVQFKELLKRHARQVKSPVLSMIVDVRVPFGQWLDIRTAALAEGFEVHTPVQDLTPVPSGLR